MADAVAELKKGIHCPRCKKRVKFMVVTVVPLPDGTDRRYKRCSNPKCGKLIRTNERLES